MREEIEKLVLNLKHNIVILADRGDFYDEAEKQGLEYAVDRLEAILALADEKNASERKETQGNGVSEFSRGMLLAAEVANESDSIYGRLISDDIKRRERAERVRGGSPQPKKCPRCDQELVNASSIGMDDDLLTCPMNMPYQGCGYTRKENKDAV